jgi:hypothetical protein
MPPPKTPSDIIISWYAESPEMKASLGLLTRPYKHIGMQAGGGVSYRKQSQSLGPTMIQAICAKYAPDVRPLRVCLIGFSEGCGGVREAIASGDGPRVDSVMAIDGIHEMWIDEKSKAKFHTGGLVKWKAYAKAAIGDGRLCCITTSSIVPPYVSTTLTSDWIWTQATGSAEATYDVPAPAHIWQGPVLPPFTNPAGSVKNKITGKVEYSWPARVYERHNTRLYRKKNGLVVWNYQNIDPSGIGDHRFQAARVTATMIASYLAPRWNNTDPAGGISLV